jgi:UDP-glucose 4-epimerase
VVHDERRVRPPDSEVQLLVSDPSRAAELIAWRPETDLDEGLARTIDWFAQRTSVRPADYAT